MNTPTGPFAADIDGGCQDGQAARHCRVNARRTGGAYFRAKPVNVDGGGRPSALPQSAEHLGHDCTDRACVLIPCPFGAPFKLTSFHDCEVVRA